MATKTKPKKAPDSWVKPMKLESADKQEVLITLGCKQLSDQDSQDLFEKLENFLTEEHAWLNHIRQLPMPSNIIAELEELYPAASALEERLRKLTAHSKNKLISVYSSHLVPDKAEFGLLYDAVGDLVRFTRIALEIERIGTEGNKKETGGSAKKRVAAYTKDSMKRISDFFDAQSNGNRTDLERKDFLKICKGYIGASKSRSKRVEAPVLKNSWL